LATGTALVISNGGETLTLAGNGEFNFSNKLSDGQSYSVEIVTQPAGATCSIANASGTIDRNASRVTNITITCVASRTVSGTLSGLKPGTSVTLTDNGTDSLALTSNGSFTFSTGLAPGSTYDVAVAVPPAGETCTVTNGTGTIVTSNVTTVVVNCT
jgi:hypothetical protein